MKKIKFIFLAIFSLFVLVACGNGSGDNNQEYNITYEKNNNYAVTNLKEKAKSGEYIEFGVKSTSVFYEISEVSANSEILDSSSNQYSFTMPKEDVTIKITIKQVSESTIGNIAFSKDTPSTIVKAREEDGFATKNLKIEFNDKTSPYITIVTSEVLIENESVIPTTAITYNDDKSAMGTIKGGTLTIDLQQVNVGETLIYVNLKPNNGTLGTIIKKLKVVEYGQVKLETMAVKFTFDNQSSYNMEDLHINIADQDYVYGTETEEYSYIYFNKLESNEFTFDYIVGHTYAVYCVNDRGLIIEMAEWIGSGSSATGYNQFKDDILSLISPVSEVPFTIID